MGDVSFDLIAEYYPEGAEGNDETFLERGVFSHGLPSLFYGSLRDEWVFELVVGRPQEACEMERVTVVDHKLGRIMAGAGYPGIFPEEGNSLTCLLAHDLTRSELARVAWYEWNEYALRHFPLVDGRVAQAFVPDIDTIHRNYGMVDPEPWSFENWRDVHYEHALSDTKAWMALMPEIPEDDPRLEPDMRVGEAKTNVR